MPHTAEETLAEAVKTYDGQEGRPLASGASPTHPGEDEQWWITDAEGNTFAVGTWTDETTILFRDYKP